MERFVDLDLNEDVIGMAALRRIKADGVKRRQLGILLEGSEESKKLSTWPEIVKDGNVIGHMTNEAWSYRLKRRLGYALVSVEAQPGDTVFVMKDGARITCQLTEMPFKICSWIEQTLGTIAVGFVMFMS